jgi:hypothetical protein
MCGSVISTIGLALDIVGVLLLLFATSQRLIEATLTVKAVDDGWITISGDDGQTLVGLRRSITFYRALYWLAVLLIAVGFGLQIAGQWLGI